MLLKLIKTTFLYDIYKRYKFHVFQRAFIKKFPNNDLIPKCIFPLDVLSVGNYSYGEINIVAFNTNSKLRIGNFVSIAQNVYFILDAEHHTDYLSTFPFKVKCIGNEKYESFSKGDIVVEDDVWIGHGATIMSGVTLGRGSVIAAGAVVTKDVEPYEIVGGIPAKTINKRFNDDLVNYLMKIDFKKWDKSYINEHLDKLYRTIHSVEDVQEHII